MPDHRIIAADWQLKAAEQGRLGAVIVPLEPEIEYKPDGWKYWSSGLFETTLAFAPDETPFSYPGSYAQLKWQKGDRIYLAEQWCIDDTSDMYFVKSAAPEAESIEWEPASTMPEESAVHWYKVTKSRVCEIQMLSINDLERACWTNDWGKVASWDEIYPNHLWNADLWVVVLEIMEVANA